jgi:hypothetical protein
VQEESDYNQKHDLRSTLEGTLMPGLALTREGPLASGNLFVSFEDGNRKKKKIIYTTS